MPASDAKPSATPSGSNAAGTAVRTSMPGALRSTAPLSFEKPVGRSSGPIAATVMHVREARRELERVALLELVARRGDRHGAAP